MGDTKMKQDLLGKLDQQKQARQEFERKEKERNAQLTKETTRNDEKMASSINAVNDGLKTEQQDRKQLLAQQGQMIAALNKQVQDLKNEVGQLKANSAPSTSSSSSSSTTT